MPKISNEQIYKTLNNHEKTLDGHTKTLNEHTKILDEHTKVLDGHTKTLRRHTRALFRLEQKVDMIDERTKFLPTLYDRVDKLVGEILEHRQERVFLHNKLQNHEERITKLEA